LTGRDAAAAGIAAAGGEVAVAAPTSNESNAANRQAAAVRDDKYLTPTVDSIRLCDGMPVSGPHSARLRLTDNKQPGRVAAAGLSLARPADGKRALPVCKPAHVACASGYLACIALIAATLPGPWHSMHCSAEARAVLRGA
jgi:hypothetical protein